MVRKIWLRPGAILTKVACVFSIASNEFGLKRLLCFLSILSQEISYK